MDNVVQFPADADTPIDITSPAFARRLGNLLSHQRTNSKLSVREMVKHSDKHFSRRDLRRYEAGEVTLDAVTAAALASLYKVDLDAILPARTEIAIDAGGGILRTGGIDALFEPGDPDSILETYLRLVRRLRNQERDDVIALRREDIDGLAAFLGRPGETVVEQLGALMGATKTQRRLMAGMFIAGAMVITVAAPTVAAITGDSGSNTPMGASNAPTNGSVIEQGAGDDGPGLDGPDPSGDPIIGNSVLLDLDDPAPLGDDAGMASDDDSGIDDEIGVDGDVDVDEIGGGTGSGVGGPTPVPGPGPAGANEGLGGATTGAPPVPGEIVVDLPVPDGTPDVGVGPDPAPTVPPADTTGPDPVADTPAVDAPAVDAPVADAPVAGTPIVVPPDADDGDFAVGPPPVAPPPDAPVVEIPVPEPAPADGATDDSEAPEVDETSSPASDEFTGDDPATDDETTDDETTDDDPAIDDDPATSENVDERPVGTAAMWVDGTHLLDSDPATGGFRTGVWGFSFVDMASTGSGTLTLEDVRAEFGQANQGRGGWAVVINGTPSANGGLAQGYTVQIDYGYSGGELILREWLNGSERSPVVRVAPTENFSFADAGTVAVTTSGASVSVVIDGTTWMQFDELRHTEGVFGVRTWHGTGLSAGAATLDVPDAPGADGPVDDPDDVVAQVASLDEHDGPTDDDPNDPDPNDPDPNEPEHETQNAADDDAANDPDVETRTADPDDDERLRGLERAQEAVGDDSTVLENAHQRANPNANPDR